MSFDTITDNLIVADTYYGIYEVNYKTGDKIRLVAPDDIINGAVSIIFDDFLNQTLIYLNFRINENPNSSIQWR